MQVNCVHVVPENIHTPHGGHFCFRPPPPWNFQLGLAPPGKTISIKNAVTLYCYAIDDCSCHSEKERSLLFMLIKCLIISILPCKDLSQLMINSKALRNMEAIPYMTQMMPSVQEPVRFKLNTEALSGFSLLVFPRTQRHNYIHRHYGE